MVSRDREEMTAEKHPGLARLSGFGSVLLLAVLLTAGIGRAVERTATYTNTAVFD